MLSRVLRLIPDHARDAVILATDLIYLVVFVLVAPWLWIKRRRAGRPTDWAGRRGFGPPLSPDPRPTVLLHGVSVGEVEALRTVVERLSSDGRARVVVSATTDTGRAAAERLYGGRCPVLRYPLDFSRCVSRFLDRVDPALVVLAELEVWPNFVRLAGARGIAVAVVNGRISEGNLRASRMAGALLRPAFGGLDLVVAQNEAYAARFRALGTPGDRVEVGTALKWEAELAGSAVGPDTLLREALGIDPARPVVLAISTGPGEERLLADARPADVQLIVAPRRPERFDQIARDLPAAPRRSRSPDGTTRASGTSDVFLLDTLGEIPRALSLAGVAVLGRSFLERGGSNPLQPAAAGVPIVIGPHHEHFAEIVETLREAGGIRVTDEPMTAVAELLADRPAASDMGARAFEQVERRRGAGARTAARLLELLESRAPLPPHFGGSDPA